MKIYVLNDTSRSHAGSQACMEYIYKELEGHEIVGKFMCGDTKMDEDAINKSEIVLCNGEGTMHHGAKKALDLFRIINLAQRMKRKTMLVNTVWQAMDMKVLTPILEKMDYICVREPFSAYAIEVKCDIVPDFCVSSYYNNYDNARKYLPGTRIAKGETHPDCHWHGILNYVDAKPELLNRPFKQMIEDLKVYEKYITGQHHGIYAAILADIQFLALPSNTWKIASLLNWIGHRPPKDFILEQWSKFSLKEKINEIS